MNKPWEQNDLNRQPLTPALMKFLNGIAMMRETLKGTRERIPPHQKFVPDWKLHEQRLDEMERLARFGGRADAARLANLNEEFMLDYQADMAATMAEVSARVVRFTDMVAQRVEEKKFELPSEVRDGLDELLDPYKEKFRDEMLDVLPIETRKQIEVEKRRMEEE